MILKTYKATLSWILVYLFGGGCRFEPTCSIYASEAIDKHGVAKGTKLAIIRVSKCHPWGESGYDPVP